MSLTHQLFLQSLRELDETSATAFEEHRGPLIATLLDHIWREVPAYHDKLTPFLVDEGFDLTHWIELPLLRHADLALDREAFTARSLRAPVEEIEDVRSPMQVPIVRRSRLSLIAAECERERCYELLGVDLAATLAVLHPDHADGPASGRGWSITFTRNSWFAGDIKASPEHQLAWLAETGARVLRTTAAVAAGLVATSSSARGTSLEAVIIADDFLPFGLATKLEETFGAKVLHIIERPVLGALASACGNADYTVPAATAIVEVVGTDGRPVHAGETGELALTPLYEFATPLLRFATGIAAVMPDDPGTMLGVRRLAGIRACVR